MNKTYDSYDLFFRFIETFAPSGFTGINPNHPLYLELEKMMLLNNQFFFIADAIQLKIVFTAKRSVEMIGVQPADLNPYHFFEATHPDDIQRHSLGRSKLFKLAQDFFIAENGSALASTNLRIRKPRGGYSNLLFQCYVFFQEKPTKTSYILQVHSNIDWCKKIKNGFHYYTGNDMSYFRYPDKELLLHGNILSDREFQIIRLIEAGMTSEQIAEKLFLSKHTINTHRSKIVRKTGKTHIADLIYDLKEQGLL